MWYWGENGRAHSGKVIVVGAQTRRTAEILGWETAANLPEALEMAQTHVGHPPSITHLKIPPINMVEVRGTRESV
jgi:hypothetical protein